MLNITTAYVVDIDDICETFGTHISDYEFCQMAENRSYQAIPCDDGTLEELYADLEWQSKKMDYHYAQRLNNQIKVIEQLRAFGHRGDVLVYVHW